MSISIGKSCIVKYNIDKVLGKKETMFFDWLKTDMISINQIFNVDNLNGILLLEDSNNPYHNGKSRILIKSLSYCESVHDIPVNYNSFNIINFIEKYKKRYNKIVEAIKNCNSTIYFLRKGSIFLEEKNQFIKNIKRINPNCQFKLVELLEHNEKNNYQKIEDNFISINLDNYLIKKKTTNWIGDYWNWEQIFVDISQ